MRTEHRETVVAMALEVTAEHPDGEHVRLDAVFGDARHAERVLWELGAEAEVLGPERLRAVFAARAAAVSALYA